MNRFTAFEQIISALKGIDGSPQYNNNLHGEVYDEWLQEVNSFPTICLVPTNEEIKHNLSNERYSLVTGELRGFTWDEDVEESGESLAEDIEKVFENWRAWSNGIDEIRIQEVETDGGLMSPEGVCIIKFSVLFRR